MNPSKTDRATTRVLTDLPNVGPSIASDLRQVGIQVPINLIGKDPFVLYKSLNEVTGLRHDPCVLDIFMSVVDYMAGNDAKPWWAYTETRKKQIRD